MASNIFKAKINQYEIRNIGTETLMNYCFTSPKREFNYKKYINLLSVELDEDESPWFLTYARFFELLKINHGKQGDAFFAPLLSEYGKELENLRESYRTNKIASLPHPSWIIWNNILAELNVADFEALPVLELNVELAQDHDGIVAFPYHKGLGIKSIVYREFMMRVLADIQSETGSQIIADWFESNNGNLYPDYPDRVTYGTEELDFDGEDAVIWGIEEQNEISIALDDNAFPETYKGAWWLDRIKSVFEYQKSNSPDWAEANKEYPFEIKSFSIVMHPAWFGSPSIDLEQVYDSTAYGY